MGGKFEDLCSQEWWPDGPKWLSDKTSKISLKRVPNETNKRADSTILDAPNKS